MCVCVLQVVYVPTASPASSQDKLLEQISVAREHEIRARSVATDTMLELPVQVPISRDGEEGYLPAQKHLLYKRRNANDTCIRAPPNKTVHDRESPPPYYSKTASLENLAHPATRTFTDSNGVPRCHSMSSSSVSNGNRDAAHLHRQLATSKTHNRTLSTNTAANCNVRTANLSSVSPNLNTDKPPDYDGVLSSDTNSQVGVKLDCVW